MQGVDKVSGPLPLLTLYHPLPGIFPIKIRVANPPFIGKADMRIPAVFKVTVRDGMEYKFLRNGKTWRLLQGADIDAWPENLYYKIEKMLNKIAGNSVNEVIEEA